MKTENTEKGLEGLIFNTRWMLYPMAMGLIAALVVYTIKFSIEVYGLMTHWAIFGTEEIMVALLGLVDMFMVANLLVMIIQGSYQIFIQRFRHVEAKNRPQWLDHVDSSILKVKIASSIAGITLIRVLKDFVNMEHADWTVVVHRMYIHGLCLLSAIVLAVIWRLLHGNDSIHALDPPQETQETHHV